MRTSSKRHSGVFGVPNPLDRSTTPVYVVFIYAPSRAARSSSSIRVTLHQKMKDRAQNPARMWYRRRHNQVAGSLQIGHVRFLAVNTTSTSLWSLVNGLDCSQCQFFSSSFTGMTMAIPKAHRCPLRVGPGHIAYFSPISSTAATRSVESPKNIKLPNSARAPKIFSLADPGANDLSWVRTTCETSNIAWRRHRNALPLAGR